MKTYIKPNTEIFAVATEQIMETVSGPRTMDSSEKVSDVSEILGKENEISTPSIWEEEE